MPVVLARYRIHTSPLYSMTAPENPTSIFYIMGDKTHVFHLSFQSCFFHLFYYLLMNLIRGHVIKYNCAHPLNTHTNTHTYVQTYTHTFGCKSVNLPKQHVQCEQIYWINRRFIIFWDCISL